MSGTDVVSPVPVRTQTNGDVVAFIADGTTNTQLLAIDPSGRVTIKLDDGNGNIVTSQPNGGQQALDVGINVAGVQIDPRQIRTLTSADVVTVDQGTNPWVTQDGADGPVTPGTVAGHSILIGGQYNSTLPTLTTGQQASVQVDSSGRLLIGSIASALPAGSNTIGAVTQASGPWTQNLTQVGGSAVSLGQKVMASSIPVTIASDQSAIPVTQSTSPWITSDLSDGSASGGTAGTMSALAGGIYNSTLPTLTTGQQASLQLDASGRLIVDIGAVTGGAISVTQGTVPWVTSDYADGSVTGGTAGTKSMLGGLIYNSAAPTLTTGQQASLQGDASGNLKVDLATALPTGSNTIGSIASLINPLPAGTNLIGGTTVYVGSTVASLTNPLPVIMTSTLPGTPVNYYHATAAIAINATDSTSVYTITALKTLNVKKVWIASSAHVRFDFQTSPDGSTYTTLFTGFTSFGGSNEPFDTDEFSIADSGTGSTVRVLVENLDRTGNAASAYVTIMGTEN